MTDSMVFSGQTGAFAHRNRRIGLLGGSFNPAHDGHRYISTEALRRLGLDEVWWLVSPQNPLKSESGMAPLGHVACPCARGGAHPRIRVTCDRGRNGHAIYGGYSGMLGPALPGGTISSG